MVRIYIKKDTVELNEEDKRPLWKVKIGRKMHTNRRVAKNWGQEKNLSAHGKT